MAQFTMLTQMLFLQEARHLRARFDILLEEAEKAKERGEAWVLAPLEPEEGAGAGLRAKVETLKKQLEELDMRVA